MAKGQQKKESKGKPKKDAKEKAGTPPAASLMSRGQTEPITKKKG